MSSTFRAAPAISVVVVNYNGGDYLRRCLASLAHQTFRDFETILVDNCSSDGSADDIDETLPRMSILREKINHGFARANNIGAKLGRGRWLALLNPDAEAMPDWLENMMHAVRERPTHRVVASLQIAMHDDQVLDGAGDCYLAYGYAWRGGYSRTIKDTPAAGECFAPCGAAALYPRDVFLACGGFDESYFCYHEDVDLGFRLRLLGERCQFDPRCVVKHAGSGITGKASSFSVFYGARNGVWTYVKNMPSVLLAGTAPLWVAGTLAILVRGLFTGRFVATAKGLGAAFAGIGRALSQRSYLSRTRTVNTVAIARALSWNPMTFLARRPDVRPFTDLDAFD
jgi:N-acetylglucosaminyl-diphospho-decaprenol L-rhamnosyltransferase